MDRWFLIGSTLLAAAAAVRGLMILRHGEKSRWTIVWMAGAFLLQLAYLMVRGELRGACPLRSIAEIAVFLAWSLTLFYLLVGPVYRISLLGVFTAPFVVIFQVLALLPGGLDPAPQRVTETSFWGETHAALSVMAYGGLALAAVAGVMFLVLDRLLKDHHFQGGLFRNLPPVRELLVSMERLLWVGMAVLTMGLIAGFLMPHPEGAWVHVIAAVVIWLAYMALMITKRVRGLAGRSFARGAVLLFVLSLGVFGFI